MLAQYNCFGELTGIQRRIGNMRHQPKLLTSEIRYSISTILDCRVLSQLLELLADEKLVPLSIKVDRLSGFNGVREQLSVFLRLANDEASNSDLINRKISNTSGVNSVRKEVVFRQ